MIRNIFLKIDFKESHSINFRYLSLLQSWRSAVLKDFGSDFVAGVLEVHDGVGDLQADRHHDRFDVERAQQTVRQDLKMF